MKDKHSLKTFTHRGLKGYLMHSFWCGGCGHSALGQGEEAGSKGEDVLLQKLNQGAKQVEHLPPATTFTLTELPLSSTTFHRISQSSSLIFWWSRRPALISFHPENQSGMRGVARRVSVHQNPPSVSGPSLPARSLGLFPGTSAALGWAQPLQASQDPQQKEREVPPHFHLFPS